MNWIFSSSAEYLISLRFGVAHSKSTVIMHFRKTDEETNGILALTKTVVRQPSTAYGEILRLRTQKKLFLIRVR